MAAEIARLVPALERDNPSWGQKTPRLPALNGILERAIKSLRWELLDQIRVATVEQLQWYLDEYRAYWNSERCWVPPASSSPSNHLPSQLIQANNIARCPRLEQH